MAVIFTTGFHKRDGRDQSNLITSLHGGGETSKLPHGIWDSLYTVNTVSPH